MSDKYYYEDFTYENYERLFKKASTEYSFVGYDEKRNDDKHILLRHDVDFSIRGGEALAIIENRLGIKATYFIYPHSEGYNLYEHATVEKIKHIIELGHDIGLHVDVKFYKEVLHEHDFEEIAKKELVDLEKLFHCKVKAVSFHNPELAFGKKEYNSPLFAGCVSAYSKEIFNEYKYVSDSNGYWRFERLEDVLISGNYKKLQILLHPIWWCEQVKSPAKRIHDYFSDDAERRYKSYCDLVLESKRENVGEEEM